MKNNWLLLLAVCSLMACGGQTTKEKEETPPATVQAEKKDVKTLSFDELFKSISAEELTDNVFKLVGKDYTVITAGKAENYNSMTASFGGWGILFGQPSTWCFLRANRYTLDVMRQETTYTMSYFADEHKEQVLFFGSKSGRDSDKMNEHALTMVATPLGDITYKEARLVIECKLTEVTTVSPDDFYTEEGRKFVTDAYDEAKEYHKLVFGEITNVWVAK